MMGLIRSWPAKSRRYRSRCHHDRSTRRIFRQERTQYASSLSSIAASKLFFRSAVKTVIRPIPSQRTQIVRHVAEFPDHLGVAEIARGRITRAAECDRANVAIIARKRLSAHHDRDRLWHSVGSPAATPRHRQRMAAQRSTSPRPWSSLLSARIGFESSTRVTVVLCDGGQSARI
jgi:hypothetical protein